MNHLHNGRPCLTCSAADTAATLARSRARWTLGAEVAFLLGVSACAVAWLLA